VTEGGADEAGVFHKIPRIDDARLAEIFTREVLSMLVRKELLSPEWAERILSLRHTGFNVHSLVRAKTKPEAERVGKYMRRGGQFCMPIDIDQRNGPSSRSMTPCSSGIISKALTNDFLTRDFHFLGRPSQRVRRRAVSGFSVKAY